MACVLLVSFHFVVMVYGHLAFVEITTPGEESLRNKDEIEQTKP